jgi:hypothetical protein
MVSHFILTEQDRTGTEHDRLISFHSNEHWQTNRFIDLCWVALRCVALSCVAHWFEPNAKTRASSRILLIDADCWFHTYTNTILYST